MAGDFNCTLHPLIDRTAGNEHHPSSAAALQTIIDYFNFTDIHAFFLQGKKTYTWSNTQGSASRLDRFYISPQYQAAITKVETAPCYLSDHRAVLMRIQLKTMEIKKPLWKLDISMLDNVQYIGVIRDFWETWRLEKTSFPDLTLWWEMGKIKLKQLSQQYSRYCATIQRAEYQQLSAELVNLEQTISRRADEHKIAEYNNIQKKLASLQKHRLHRPLTTLHHQFLNENDTCTHFFFQREKTKTKQNFIVHLKEGTNIISEPAEIRQRVTAFYTQLYSPEPINQGDLEFMKKHAAPLPDHIAAIFERPLSLDEVLKSLRSQNNRKLPGIDGLPADFFKKFEELFAPDILEVYNFSIQNNRLPLSSRRAIITLLPKTGDLGALTNWRPVSLLCSDYKIFTKILVNRMQPFMHYMVHIDQTYSVINRSIHYNLHLLRDVISLANLKQLPLALVNMDQMKAFDRVHHTYLFEILKSYNFGPFFLSLLKLAYTEPYFLLKVNNTLTAPHPFKRGLRQGCSLSAALYILALEPFLNAIRASNTIAGLTFPGYHVKLSAYADDVTLLVTNNTAWRSIADIICKYEQASNAKINYNKSNGLWCGAWKNRTDAPLHMKWGNTPLKILGIYLGNNNIVQRNYENTLTSLKNTLNAWAPIAKALSYRGRTLVINQICAPQLWHRLACISPLLSCSWRSGGFLRLSFGKVTIGGNGTSSPYPLMKAAMESLTWRLECLTFGWFSYEPCWTTWKTLYTTASTSVGRYYRLYII